MTKILVDEGVVQQALDALCTCTPAQKLAITALRSALQAEKVEPFDPEFPFGPEVFIDAAPTPPTNTDELREAARAVVERWDSPLWKDLPHTGTFIDRLRKALA